MPEIPLDVMRTKHRPLRYRFVEPSFQSDRPFAIERDPEVIDMCASRLAGDARLAMQLCDPYKPGDDPRDATRTETRTMMIYDEIPSPSGAT